MKSENTSPKWKIKKINDNNPFGEITQWVTDKEKRATSVWMGSIVGATFIILYYFYLGDGFTPSVNLAQASLILIKAFILGTLMVIGFSMGMFSPALTYRICKIEISQLNKENRIKAIKALFIRLIVAQGLVASLAISIYPFMIGEINHFDWPITLASAAFCAIFSFSIYKLPNLSQFGHKESKKDFIFTISIATLLSLFSLIFIVLLIYGRQKNASAWEILMAWIIIVFYSGLLSVIPKDKSAAINAIILAIVIDILYMFDIAEPCVKAIAYSIGIAEKNPVTLVLPKETCLSIQKAIKKPHSLQCDNSENSGVLQQVLLRSSWGDRWNIRTDEKSESIIFDGKGVVVRKDLPQKNP